MKYINEIINLKEVNLTNLIRKFIIPTKGVLIEHEKKILKLEEEIKILKIK